ncbi:MAG: hypothetical protein A3C22_02015 [Candidatus Levybacteria bacterium RIFCSPHIGHO2_02_FULL_37_10]|nr:MAG: hypothetical protein A3C22_02015 [Candidatus Levybacteria bacterium RIFCSPHIGHO2_02_FULL_37_10]
MNFFDFLNSIYFPNLGLNWLDFIIITVLLFYSLEGYSLGFIASLLDLIGFVSSFIIGLKTYSFFSKALIEFFSIPPGFSNALGFLIAAFIAEIIIGLILRKIVYSKYFSRFTFRGNLFKNIDHLSGLLFGIFSGFILFAFLLTIVIALPVSVFLKHSVSSSIIGNFLVSKTAGFEKDLNNVFGGAINETINFLTVEPGANETVSLNFKTKNFSVDQSSEKAMFGLVNNERTSREFTALTMDTKLTEVARDHCRDMFARGYFSHYTPEGLSPFDRMAQADIGFTYAGENLALAPNVTVSMQGLMQSPGHRANILSANFGKIGVGVVDGGIYGQMYCQEFSD